MSCFGLPWEQCELLKIRNLVRAETLWLSSFIADVFHPHISLKEEMCCLGEVKVVKNGCRWSLTVAVFIHHSSLRGEKVFSQRTGLQAAEGLVFSDESQPVIFWVLFLQPNFRL